MIRLCMPEHKEILLGCHTFQRSTAHGRAEIYLATTHTTMHAGDFRLRAPTVCAMLWDYGKDEI